MFTAQMVAKLFKWLAVVWLFAGTAIAFAGFFLVLSFEREWEYFALGLSWFAVTMFWTLVLFAIMLLLMLVADYIGGRQVKSAVIGGGQDE